MVLEWSLYTAAMVFFPWGSMGCYYSWGNLLFTEGLHVLRSKEINICYSVSVRDFHILINPWKNGGGKCSVIWLWYKLHVMSCHRSWELLQNSIWKFCSRHMIPCCIPVQFPLKWGQPLLLVFICRVGGIFWLVGHEYGLTILVDFLLPYFTEKMLLFS